VADFDFLLIVCLGVTAWIEHRPVEDERPIRACYPAIKVRKAITAPAIKLMSGMYG
jgi:hypothetical protein